MTRLPLCDFQTSKNIIIRITMKMSVYKILSNNTVLNGTLVRLPTDTFVQQTTNATTADENYDAIGAMQFIVATILVYSIIGVFCTLILRIRRLRGKSHENYLQDESVSRYLKTETLLKLDGKRVKWLQECQQVSERLRYDEEKQRYFELERELTRDFAVNSMEERRPISKTKSGRKTRRELKNTIGKMGVALLHVDSKGHMLTDDITVHSDNNIDEELLELPRSCESHSQERNSPLDSLVVTKLTDKDINLNNNIESELETEI